VISRPLALRRVVEIKPPAQPWSLADAIEDEEATEDEVITGDAETTAKTKIATTIRNTLALVAN